MAGVLRISLALLLLTTSTVVAGPVDAAQVPVPPPLERDQITAGHLDAGRYTGPGPVHNAYFGPLGEWGPPLHELEGTLVVGTGTIRSTFRQGFAHGRRFPAFSVEFFSHGDRLVPVERGIIAGQDWDLLLAPGRVWSEPADGDRSRGAFPFHLIERGWWGVHNGVATFLYDDTGVSSLRFQITQETNDQRWDGWGQLEMIYVPGPIAGGADLRAAFAEEMAQQIPVRPWDELERLVDPALLAEFTGGLPPAEVNAAGIVLDGVLYLQPPMTRYGPFPFPLSMRHTAYSVTKSAGAALSLFRLAEKYGEWVPDERIVDHVEVLADHDGWEDVTFADALSMTVGVGAESPTRRPLDTFADENQPSMFRAFQEPTAAGKLAEAFRYPDYPWGPGEIVRYNSTHTMVLTAALQHFVEANEGPGTDVWDLMTEEVLNPAGIAAIPVVRTREEGGEPGTPLLFTGMVTNVDDLAKLTMVFQGSGVIGGEQVLDADLVQRALFRTDDPGLPVSIGNRHGNGSYLLSFWSWPYRTADGRYLAIPYMMGYGGKVVVLAPNGVSGFVFTHSGTFVVDPQIRVLEAIRPFPGDGTMAGGPPLVAPGIWLLPEVQQTMWAVFWIVLAWMVLVVGALALLGGRMRRDRPPVGLGIAWAAVTLILGPLGLAAYLVSGRRPVGRSQTAIGSAALAVIGPLAGIGLGMAVFGELDPRSAVLALATGLLVVRAPLVRRLRNWPYWRSVWHSIPWELISLSGVLIGAVLVADTLGLRYFRYFGFDPDPISLTWLGIGAAAALAGFVTGYPMQLWIAGRGETPLAGPVPTEGPATPRPMATRIRVWAAVAVSIGLVAGAMAVADADLL